jgi:hypothetical protein
MDVKSFVIGHSKGYNKGYSTGKNLAGVVSMEENEAGGMSYELKANEEDTSLRSKGVDFYDYDGTLLYSYTVEEAQGLTELPALPTHSGLICQEWNWSWEDAIDYVSKYKYLDIGATYITNDGKTRLYINIPLDNMSMTIALKFTNSDSVKINWGDGIENESVAISGHNSHFYSLAGNYCISIEVQDDTTVILAAASNASYSTGVFIPEPSSIGSYLMASTVYKIELGRNIQLASATLVGMINLKEITIPNSISIESSFEANSYSVNTRLLQCIVLPNTNISKVNMDRSKVMKCIIPNRTLYKYCVSSYEHIIKIPSDTTMLENSIYSDFKQAVWFCIPSSVLSIQNYAFNRCYVVSAYYFGEHTSIPTLASTNAFTNIPTSCKIIVPDALYDEWIAATNWSTYASYIIKASEFNG